MKKLWLILWAVVGMGLVSARAQAALNSQALAEKIKLRSPASGANTEIVKAEAAEIFAVVARYQGPALPGDRSIVIELSPPDTGKVFTAFVLPQDFHWTDPLWVDSFMKINPQTQFAVWREKSGVWGTLVALSGSGMNTFFETDGTRLFAVARSRDDKFAPTRVPMFVIGFSDNPYQLIKDCYAFGLKVMKAADPEHVIGNLRVDKKFPPIFKYLGWCSWNTYYQNVTEKKLVASARSFKKAGVPIHYMIIDDGWMQTAQRPPVHDSWRKGSLISFEADPKKFPQGLAHAAQTLKNDYGVKHVGVWLTFQGYWNGVALDSEIGREYKDSLWAVSDQVGIPDPRSDAGEKFWEGWFGFLSGAGFDLVKVDNQSDLAGYVHGMMPSAYAMAFAQKNITGPTRKYFDNNFIDCMEMNVDTIYQWTYTNSGRASRDFSPPDYANPRIHQVQSVMNALWLSNLLYPDYDMYMTHDRHADYHSVARAISGGAIYLTDRPGRTHPQYYQPLVYSDGEIILVDEPGLPARESILEDPYLSGKPLVAFAKSNGAGMLAAWNVSKKYKPVQTELSPQDVDGLKGDKFALYDHFEGTVRVLNREQKFPVKMPPWKVKLFVLAPIANGFAPIGLANKYISPATIKESLIDEQHAVLKLAESGPFAAYCQAKPKVVKVNGKEIAGSAIYYSDNLLKVDLPKEAGPVELEIIF